MAFTRLTSQINDLSEQVETLILEGDEEQCPALLAQRQELLEELSALMLSKNTSFSQDYRRFLMSIQSRDERAIELIAESKTKIILESSNQKKRNNALNVYHKFSE